MTPDRNRRNVLLLALCQALGMSCTSFSMTVSSLVGLALAPAPHLATLPIGLHYVGSMLATLPASHLMRRFGRRAGFSFGAFLGVLSGATCAQAVASGNFPLFCLGTTLLGAFNGHFIFYRFAAADSATPLERGRAISLVLAGGLAAAFLGPELAKVSRHVLDWTEFLGGYLAISLLSGLSIVALQFLRIPRPALTEAGLGEAAPRPLWHIVRQPKLLLAVACGMVSYGAMNFIMVSTPLAMVGCGHQFESAASVVQWHIVGMYLPSFFTGRVIHALGVYRVLGLGALVILVGAATAWSGNSFLNFWIALFLLGLGWNFLFVGGSVLLTETYRRSEMAKVQGLNDFLVSGTVAATALSSGAVFAALGWESLIAMVFLPLLLVFVAIFGSGLASARQARAENRP